MNDDDYHCFYRACEDGNLEVVKQLSLKYWSGGDLSVKWSRSKSTFLDGFAFAIEHNRPDIVAFLLTVNGFDSSWIWECNIGMTRQCLVLSAIRHDNADILRLLIASMGTGGIYSGGRSQDPEYDDAAQIAKRDRLPFHWAIASNSIKCVQTLFELGVDVNARDNVGDTALFAAAANGNWRCMGMMVERGGDVSIRNWHQQTALYYAIYTGEIGCARILIEYGASPLFKHIESPPWVPEGPSQRTRYPVPKKPGGLFLRMALFRHYATRRCLRLCRLLEPLQRVERSRRFLIFQLVAMEITRCFSHSEFSEFLVQATTRETLSNRKKFVKFLIPPVSTELPDMPELEGIPQAVQNETIEK